MVKAGVKVVAKARLGIKAAMFVLLVQYLLAYGLGCCNFFSERFRNT